MGPQLGGRLLADEPGAERALHPNRGIDRQPEHRVHHGERVVRPAEARERASGDQVRAGAVGKGALEAAGIRPAPSR